MLWLVTVDMKIEVITAVIFISVVLEFRLTCYTITGLTLFSCIAPMSRLQFFR